MGNLYSFRLGLSRLSKFGLQPVADAVANNDHGPNPRMYFRVSYKLRKKIAVYFNEKPCCLVSVSKPNIDMRFAVLQVI